MSDTGNIDLNNLSPDELQMLQLLMMQQGMVGPGTFGGDLGPSLDQTGIDLAGYFPTNIPTRNAKGVVEKYELPQEQARVNLAQDLINTSDDPMLAAFGGLGAIGPNAFTPTYDYGQPLNLKGRKKAESYIDTGGYRGYIADLMLNHGMGPDEAAAKAIDLANNTKVEDLAKMSPEDAKLVQALQKTLPALKTAGSQAGPPSETDGGAMYGRTKAGGLPGGRAPTSYDEAKVLGDATSMFEDISSDPAFAYYDEATGNYYDKTPEQAMVKTPFMEAFEKAGIPYLTDQYTDQSYIDRAVQGETGRGPQQQAAASDDFQRQLAAMEKEQQQRRNDIASQTDMLKNGLSREPVLPPTKPFMPGLDIVEDRPTVEAGTQSGIPNVLGGLGAIWDFLGPGGGGAEAKGPEPTKRIGPKGMHPQMQNPIYVDQNGNVVMPPTNPTPAAAPSGAIPTVAGGRKSTAELTKERGLTKREMQPTDRSKVEQQLASNRNAEDAFYKQRSDMWRSDPDLVSMGQFARARALSQAGRTPTRDALMQRLMALKAMGIGRG
jgi:hypothetical protein